ncbi:MAG: hypothetical protein ACYCXA_13190, partial [Actinomycetes bacterium]
MLRRAVDTIGSNTVADLLGVSKSQPRCWRGGQEGIGATDAMALAALDGHLGGATPIGAPWSRSLVSPACATWTTPTEPSGLPEFPGVSWWSYHHPA